MPARTVSIRWSWPVLRLFGIEVRVHATLALVFAWIAFAEASAGAGPADLAAGLGLIVCLFAIVLVHELGHALTARRFGIATRDITLLPIGGLSRLERMPDRPGQELLVAVAGPAVNVVLAAILLGVMALLRLPVVPARLGSVETPFLAQLLWMNVSLAVFNLLPAFPTDGGRALRALLALRLAPERATVVAAGIGKVMAVGFGLVGLAASPLLVLVAAFLFLGANEEARWARLKAAVAHVPVARAMVTAFRPLDAQAPLEAAAELVLAGAPADFPVLRDGRLVGVLTRADLVAGLREAGFAAPVAAAMHDEIDVVAPTTPLAAVLERLRVDVPVVVERAGAVVGLLTAASLADLTLFAPALRAAPAT